MSDKIELTIREQIRLDDLKAFTGAKIKCPNDKCPWIVIKRGPFSVSREGMVTCDKCGQQFRDPWIETRLRFAKSPGPTLVEKPKTRPKQFSFPGCHLFSSLCDCGSRHEAMITPHPQSDDKIIKCGCGRIFKPSQLYSQPGLVEERDTKRTFHLFKSYAKEVEVWA